MKEIMAS